MKGKILKELLRGNLFWVIMVSLVVLVVAGLKLTFYYLDNKEPVVEVELGAVQIKYLPPEYSAKFTVPCFEKKLILECRAPDGADNYCTEDFKKNLKSICSQMELLGTKPLDKIKVNIVAYKKCDQAIEEETGCWPIFKRTNKRVGGYTIAIIYLSVNGIKNKKYRTVIFSHEINHALASK